MRCSSLPFNSLKLTLWHGISVKTLNKKLKRAGLALEETNEALEGLNEGLSKDLVSKWEKAEQKAMSKRGRFLKCYNVSSVKPASMVEIQIRLLGGQGLNGHAEGSVAWLASGIALEAAQ